MDIVSLISDIAATVTDTPTFEHGERGWQNLVADKIDWNDGAIFLDEPITSNDINRQSGYLEETYPLKILFAKKSALDFTPTQHQTLIQDCREMRREFIVLLENNDNIRAIANIRTTDIINLFDQNISGCYLTVDVTPFNTGANCFPAESDGISLSFTIVNATEFGAEDGRITVIATGGTGPYTYLWSNGKTTARITGLEAGEYSVTVTDSLADTAYGEAVVTQPEEEIIIPDDEVAIEISDSAPVAIPYPINGQSFNNMSTKGAMMDNAELLENLALLNIHMAWYTGDGNTGQVQHYPDLNEGDGYNHNVQEIINAGKTVATVANGVCNQTYGFDFFHDFAEVVNELNIPFVALGVPLCGALSPYASTSLISPDDIDFDELAIGDVIDDCGRAVAILSDRAPSAEVGLWELWDEAVISGNKKYLDNADGSVHGVNVYAKMLSEPNDTSAVSILDALADLTPDADIQAEGMPWKLGTHKYTSVDGGQEWDDTTSQLPHVTHLRDYFQDPHPITSYATARAYMRDHMINFWDHATDAENNGKKRNLSQIGTDVPVSGWNESVGKGLLLLERNMILISERHLHMNALGHLCNYNLKTLLKFSDNYRPLPAFYFMVLVGEWLKDGNYFLLSTTVNPLFADLRIETIQVGSERRMLIFNPTANSYTIPNPEHNGDEVTEYDVHGYYQDGEGDPSVVYDYAEFNESDEINIRPYCGALVTFEIP